jgi:hypothetical protein
MVVFVKSQCLSKSILKIEILPTCLLRTWVPGNFLSYLLVFKCLLTLFTKLSIGMLIACNNQDGIPDHLSSCLRILYRHLASLGACGQGRVHVLCCRCCASVAVQDPLQAPTRLDRCSAHYVQGMCWLRSQPSVVQQVPGVAL